MESSIGLGVYCLIVLPVLCSGRVRDSSAVQSNRRSSLAVPQSIDGSYDGQSCPTWFYPQVRNGSASGGCQCGKSLGQVVHCDQQHNVTSLLMCFCMTYHQNTDEVVVGSCLYTCPMQVGLPIPPDPAALNDVICGFYNRKGQLCGECKTNYSQPVYSYSMRCVECSEDGAGYRLMKYLAVAFLPLTVFLLVVVTLRINVASGRLNGFVMLNQLALTAPQMRIIVTTEQLGHLGQRPGENTFFYLVLTVYSIWNLDFFRLFYSPFCIHPGMSTLSVIALDYVIAVYPLVLIVAIYVLVELHDRHCRLLVCLWKPFHWCLARFRRQWNIRTSLLDAFVTFFLLASVKFLNVTMDLLLPISIYNVHGNKLNALYLFSDASVEYFGKEHLPYAILAVAVLLVFIILPIVLLLVYPCCCFQRCLNRCRLRCQTLHMVMDVFQGCYKNGTNGTRDCRYFAAVYPILRVMMFVLLAITRSVIFYPTAVATIIMVVAIIATLTPYRYHQYNTYDMFLLLTLAVVFTAEYSSISRTLQFLGTTTIMIGVSSSVPLICSIGLLLYWLVRQKRLLQVVLQSLGKFKCTANGHSDPQNYRLSGEEDYIVQPQSPALDTERGGEGDGGGGGEWAREDSLLPVDSY